MIRTSYSINTGQLEVVLCVPLRCPSAKACVAAAFASLTLCSYRCLLKPFPCFILYRFLTSDTVATSFRLLSPFPAVDMSTCSWSYATKHTAAKRMRGQFAAVLAPRSRFELRVLTPLLALAASSAARVILLRNMRHAGSFSAP